MAQARKQKHFRCEGIEAFLRRSGTTPDTVEVRSSANQRKKRAAEQADPLPVELDSDDEGQGKEGTDIKVNALRKHGETTTNKKVGHNHK